MAEDTEGGEDEEEDASRFGIIQDFVKAKKSKFKTRMMEKGPSIMVYRRPH